ncbi:MAG TPA: sugar ABC transporter permease [Candidatus Coproplasma excrementipullorum]|nr:sugar ABC transporter permease [Candidatus Coproplasma excrementipullorum]
MGGKKSGFTVFILLLPYLLAFCIFIVLPVILAIILSFTDFNSISAPSFTGLLNYIRLFTEDEVFMQHVIPNTLLFSVIAGPVGYFLSFFLAWLLAQVPKGPRTILALCIYAPSLTSGVAMQVVWTAIFSGDPNGYLNAILLKLGVISEAVQWLQSGDYLMTIMIIVTIWSSMGLGFLSMLSGILNIDPELYEAAYMDGMRNRFQEIIYVTIPSIKPQMLFGAVMAVVNTFQAGAIGVELSGSNPTPNYNGQLIINHIQDYGYIRYEMGYAAAISVVLLILIYIVSKVIMKVLSSKDD